MKTLYRVIGIGSLAVLFFLGFTPGSEAQVIQMKFAHYAEETHPGNLAAKQFAAKVEERTQGKVKIAIYPANT
jgi:TRAP-type C4-dicarboxylate transport system substrate-binding protein